MGESELEELVELLGDLDPALRGGLVLPAATLMSQPALCVQLHGLVALRYSDEWGDLRPALCQLREATLLVVGHPEDAGLYGWLERKIKPVLLDALARWLDVKQPLSPFGLAELPLQVLAERSSDPVELSRMVRYAVQHRLQHPLLGLSPEDWQLSLDQAQGRVVGQHLRGLTAELAAAAVDRWLGLTGADPGPAWLEAGLARQEGDEQIEVPLVRERMGVGQAEGLLRELPLERWSAGARDWWAEQLKPAQDVAEIWSALPHRRPHWALLSTFGPFEEEGAASLQEALGWRRGLLAGGGWPLTDAQQREGAAVVLRLGLLAEHGEAPMRPLAALLRAELRVLHSLCAGAEASLPQLVDGVARLGKVSFDPLQVLRAFLVLGNLWR
jgi:hypothetical protein